LNPLHHGFALVQPSRNTFWPFGDAAGELTELDAVPVTAKTITPAAVNARTVDANLQRRLPTVPPFNRMV
jgi:hypothetical protein